jgi:hypothetical protein
VHSDDALYPALAFTGPGPRGENGVVGPPSRLDDTIGSPDTVLGPL